MLHRRLKELCHSSVLLNKRVFLHNRIVTAVAIVPHVGRMEKLKIARVVASILALISGLRQQHVSLPVDDPAADEYGVPRAHLAKLGTPIGPNDLLIAAIALA